VTAHPDPESRLRLFVALALPADVRRALAEWSRTALGGYESLRLVDADLLHVTLAFLGWRGSDDIDRVGAAMSQAVSGRPAPCLHPECLVALPQRAPRVLAIDLRDENGGATSIQQALSDALARANLYRPERRPFRPHLTVARVRGRSARRYPTLPDPPMTPTIAREVVLYRSELLPTGARYTALARAELTHPGA
jgi:2'-5' RNA ligase